MSGGSLVVVDRSGRDVKRYPLEAGLATLGSELACDIRVLQAQVQPHHATVVVHAAQSVVRNVGSGVTLVNGRAVSVAALRHGDVITLGDRNLRWEYSQPHNRKQHSGDAGVVALPVRGGGAGAGGGAARRRGASAGGARTPRDRDLQLALEMNHRASMPGSTGGKQVAVVQPQRRDTTLPTDKNLRASPLAGSRRTKTDLNSSISSDTDSDKSKRKASNRASPKSILQNTTKATLWIESRKTNPRKKQTSPQVVLQARRSLPAKRNTPLRLTVLKKAQSARKVVKIEAPLKIDHTKQAAIMLMTGHTPKLKLSLSPQNRSNSKRSPSFVVKKQSPVRKTPRGRGSTAGRTSRAAASGIGVTPSRSSTFAQDSSNRRSSKRNSGNQSVTILEITDSTQNSTIRASSVSTRSKKSSIRSPSLPSSPKKSAMKDLSKKNTRKAESIKFDLSNLDNCQDTTDALAVTNVTHGSENRDSEDDLTLHYSDSSNQSPSPRKSINSRNSGSILEKVGDSVTPTASRSSLQARASRTLTPDSPRARKSIRGSASAHKTMGTSQMSEYTKTDVSGYTTDASAFRNRALSPRNNLESYSVVDLVSLDSNNSKSIYNSAGSIDTTDFGTPISISTRKTRSTINPTLLGSSTPYVGGTRATRSKSSSNIQNKSTRSSVSTRRSKSLSTPENKSLSVNSIRVSRASRSRSRINDSDLLLLDDTEVEDSSPRTSKRSRTTKSVTNDISVNKTANSPDNQGLSTPEIRHSPVEVGTPVLSIQSLLESSLSSEASQNSVRRGRRSAPSKRKTIGVLSVPKVRHDNKSKSLGASVRKVLLRMSGDSSASSDRTDEGAPKPDNEEIVTPTSAVKLSPEAVKNKHSTAKKPQSKRSLIDNLNHSDHVKKLFNSPVKRKLSQSMTEFSRKQLFDDDDDVQQVRRPTRNTVALTERTPSYSILDQTEAITPERFVSPISTPGNSPNLSGIKRLFKKNTPGNDLSDVRGVRSLLRTPHPRKSIKNDLSNVDAVKTLFVRSPKNRLSDVRVKEVFVVSPNNDLRRVGGVKALFQKPPKNDLTDIRGVRKMFQKKSPQNDLRNVSGVKRTLRHSPKNDLTDVRGVRRMFKPQKQSKSYHDVSGVEELFNESNQSVSKSESLFDMLVGKPTIKAVYSKTFSAKSIQKPKTRRAKSLHSSIDVITNNVEEWLEKELQKSLHNKSNVTRQLKMLATDTVGGGEPICTSRTRNSSMAKKSASEIYSAHKLPIKKRSLAETSLKKSMVNLPIKKRVVVHSTPVKGRTNLTMNASELGRVSPIPAVDNIREEEPTTSNRSTQIIMKDKVVPVTVKARTPRKQQTPKKIDISKPSPIKSPEKEISLKRSTRVRKDMDTTNTKKRRSSLVITKKPPVMSPKAKPKTTNMAKEEIKEVSLVASPKKTRATRGKKEVAIGTPKRTRTRTTKATVVITKPSPKLKPQSKAKAAQKKTPEKPSGTRKATVLQVTVSPKESPKRTRTARVITPVKKLTLSKKNTKSPQVVKPVQTRRGRNLVAIEPITPKSGRKATATETNVQDITSSRTSGRKNVNTESNKKVVQPKTRKIVEVDTNVQPEPTKRGRGRKTNVVVEEIQPVAHVTKAKVVVEEKKSVARGRKTNAVLEEKQSVGRGKKTKVVLEEKQPLSRGRRTHAVVEEIQSLARGKKTKVVLEEKQPLSRGRRTNAVVEETQSVARGKKAVAKAVENEPKTRGKKAETTKNVIPETAVARSRRAKPSVDLVVPETKGRKRKAAAIDTVPSKVAKAEPKKANKAVSPATGGKQKRAVSKQGKAENVQEPAKKTTRGTNLKKLEDAMNQVTETKPVRGKKTVERKLEKKESVTAASARGKRKANAEPSPAKVAAKKVATKKPVHPAPAAARGRPVRTVTADTPPPSTSAAAAPDYESSRRDRSFHPEIPPPRTTAAEDDAFEDASPGRDSSHSPTPPIYSPLSSPRRPTEPISSQRPMLEPERSESGDADARPKPQEVTNST